MKRIGIGIVTCNRPIFLQKLLESIQGYVPNELVIINDGDNINIKNFNSHVIQNETNLGVCKSKNRALKHLLNAGCDYIFIIEDDMLIKDYTVFDAYIKAYEVTGIHHMMFAYHGPANKGNVSGGTPKPRKIIDYGDGVQISLNMHCVGAFCFYTRECLEKVGLFDKEYNKNNFEHVDHSYRLAKAEYSTPYWWWADLANSTEYIEEQACSEKSSSIRKGDDWREKIIWSAKLFKRKHGVMPAWNNCVPNVNINSVLALLKCLKPTNNVVFTSYFTSKSDPQRDIKWPENNFALFKNWYNSLRTCGVHGIIFHDNLSKEFVNKHTTCNLKFVKCNYANDFSTNDFRFFVYYDYLKQNNNIQNVFLTDMSDVVMKQNPFNKIKKGYIYAGYDCINEPIAMSSWKSRKKYGYVKDYMDFWNTLSNQHVINAGVLGGTRSTILSFLEKVTSELKKVHTLNANNNMPVVNYVLYKYFNNKLCLGAPVCSRFKMNEINKKNVWFVHK